MCGIAGLIGSFANNERLGAMLHSQLHRGPDSEGRFVSDNLAMGMRRLSIVDVAGGDQPRSCATGRIKVFMNGEIYNHQDIRKAYPDFNYTSQTDTEVIPHLWATKGQEALQELCGMFALAIWNETEHTLTLVRDRLGIKPLWVYESAEGLAWSSEIRSFAEAGLELEVNPQGLWDFMTHGYIPAPRSPFTNVRSLVPGELLRVKLTAEGRIETTSKVYWDLPKANWAEVSPSAAVGHVKDLLNRSVEEHLMADVPLGCLLSGGLDSGLLTAWASKLRGEPIKTFSVGFAQKSFDERGEAKLLAKHLGCAHFETELKEEDFLTTLDIAMKRTDTLLADPAMVALVPLYELVSSEVTVVLDGDGADELFGGYPTVTANKMHGIISKLPMPLRKALKSLSQSLPESQNKAGFFFKLERLLRNADLNPGQAHALWRNIHKLQDKENLVSQQFHPQSFEEKMGITHAMASYGDIKRFGHRDFTRNDMKVWLPDDNLKKVDGQSMGVSVEARVPFLDHRLVEAVMPLSMSLKRRFGVKGLLREAGRGILKDEFLYRKKASFHLPLAHWMKGSLKQEIVSRLENLQELTGGYFNAAHLRKFVENERSDAYSIFNLIALESWFKQWPTRLTLAT